MTPSVVKYIEEKNVMNVQNVGHTIISYIFNLAGIFIMLYIGIRYVGSSDPYNRAYANYAFLLSIFGILGFFSIDYYDNKQINFYPKQWKKFDSYKFLVAFGALFFISMVVDFLLKVTIRYALAGYDLALYYVFAGVCEEAFFRGCIINVIIGLSERLHAPKMFAIFLAIIISSAAFMLAHLSVYGSNMAMLTSTFVGGIILGIFYVVFRDIGANMAAHAAKNVVGYINLVHF